MKYSKVTLYLFALLGEVWDGLRTHSTRIDSLDPSPAHFVGKLKTSCGAWIFAPRTTCSLFPKNPQFNIPDTPSRDDHGLGCPSLAEISEFSQITLPALTGMLKVGSTVACRTRPRGHPALADAPSET